MTTHVPLLVRAHLAAGIALDGILAAEMWAEQKASSRAAGTDHTSALAQADPTDLDLPLTRCQPRHGPWHWAATCAYPEQASDRLDVHTWSGRVDHRHLEQATHTLPKVISTRQGRYRSRLMPLLVTPCASIAWHAIGDPALIADLLTPIASIGKKRTSGEGHVLRWEIRPQPSMDPFAAAHLHPDSTLGRPTPGDCLIGRIVTDGGTGRAGVRPPYMHPARQHELRLPTLLQS